MTAHIVVGIGFGDEGKGRVTQRLFNEVRDAVVVRTGGGPNCGHTVRRGSAEHICSTFTANCLQGGAGILGPKVLVSPEMYQAEFKVIKSKTGNGPSLTIDRFCQIITPYDVLANQQNELSLGASTGKGIHETQKRIDAGVNFLVQDLYGSGEHISNKLKSVRDYYKAEREEVLEHKFFSGAKFLCGAVSTSSYSYFSNIIFEGNQGFYLDEEFGYFPHVTHASTTVKNAALLLKKWKRENSISISDIRVHYVTRAYSTRHGEGPFYGGKVKLKASVSETNVTNEFQGDFKIAPFNLEACKHAIETNKLILKHILNSTGTPFIHVTCTDDLVNFDPDIYKPLSNHGQVQFHD